jgi:hypothetical protein
MLIAIFGLAESAHTEPKASESKKAVICDGANGYVACIGTYGQGCYKPSAGQTCTNGLVCNGADGYVACIKGGSAVCYKPSAGQTCN